MARRKRNPEQIERFRSSINAEVLRDILHRHATENLPLSQTQIRAIETLLAYAIPKENIVKSEISGPGGAPVGVALSVDQRVTRLLQLLAVAKAKA